MRTLRVVILGLLGVLPSLPARATVTEPNGTVVPLDSANGETQLYTFFTNQGEPLDWKNDAHTTPATFSPLCDFTATYVLSQASNHYGVGWYNVDPMSVTAPSGMELHTIVPANAPVGTVINSADIKNDPAYTGGLIGFALLGGQTHFSEQQWNIDCTGCSAPGPWALALIYKSVIYPNSYYLAFENGTVSATSFNNDGDFNDAVFLLSGLACAGAGQACDTGLQGVCGQGLTECDNTGVLTCKQVNQASAVETCDGLDNDCNGQVDDTATCPGDKICSKGQCVDPCGTGEFFFCQTGQTCDSGVCIDSACVGINCGPGQTCQAGTCKGACDGVVCPHDQVCRLGVCLDPCQGVTCPSGRVCQAGACVTSCSCEGCGSGTTCDDPSGQCIDNACVSMTCGAGTYCALGNCVDDCDSVLCPTGQACQMGQCLAVLTTGDGGTTSTDGGAVSSGDAGSGSNDGGIAIADTTGDAGTGSNNPGGGVATKGCKCDVGGSGQTPTGLLSILGLALFFVRRRLAKS